MLSKVCVIPSQRYTGFRHWIIADEQYGLLSNGISQKSALYTVMMVEYTFWEVALHKNMCSATESSQTSSTGSCRMEFLKSLLYSHEYMYRADVSRNVIQQASFSILLSGRISQKVSSIYVHDCRADFLRNVIRQSSYSILLCLWILLSDGISQKVSSIHVNDCRADFLRNVVRQSSRSILEDEQYEKSAVNNTSITSDKSGSNALRRTAMHCNVLQRTTTHTQHTRNTLQHIHQLGPVKSGSNTTLQHSATCATDCSTSINLDRSSCNTLKRNATQCITVQHTIT